MTELALSGLAIGSIYSILILGYVLVFRCTKVFNLAQGSLVLIGAYVSYGLIAQVKLPIPLAIVISFFFSFFLGFVLERLVLRPMIGEPLLSVLLLTIGLSEIIKAVVGLIWGTWLRLFPSIYPGGDITLGGYKLPPVYFWATIISLSVFGVFLIFYQRSSLGISMRAVAGNQDWASLMGINVKRVFALSWAFSSVIGAIAGVFLASMLSVNLALDTMAFRAFPGAILGGIDSIIGALVGGLVIGLAENLIGGGILDPLLGGGTKEVLSYLVMLVVLMVRPYGLFGTEKIERL